MAPKLTAADVYARIKQTQEDTDAFKAYWQASLPADLPVPPDHEIKNAVRRLPLAYLAEGIESYVTKIGKTEGKEAKPVGTKNAMNYICGAAWKMLERDNPDQEFHPTARRQRNAERDPNSPLWDGEAFGDMTPEARQRVMAETIAKQKAQGAQ
jgi:hypothetical protein